MSLGLVGSGMERDSQESGMDRCGTAGPGGAGSGVEQCGSARQGGVWKGEERAERPVWSGMVRTGMVRSGTQRQEVAGNGQVRRDVAWRAFPRHG